MATPPSPTASELYEACLLYTSKNKGGEEIIDEIEEKFDGNLGAFLQFLAEQRTKLAAVAEQALSLIHIWKSSFAHSFFCVLSNSCVMKNLCFTPQR